MNIGRIPHRFFWFEPLSTIKECALLHHSRIMHVVLNLLIFQYNTYKHSLLVKPLSECRPEIMLVTPPISQQISIPKPELLSVGFSYMYLGWTLDPFQFCRSDWQRLQSWGSAVLQVQFSSSFLLWKILLKNLVVSIRFSKYGWCTEYSMIGIQRTSISWCFRFNYLLCSEFPPHIYQPSSFLSPVSIP